MIGGKSKCYYCGYYDFCTTMSSDGDREECDHCSKLIARFGRERIKDSKGRFPKKNFSGQVYQREEEESGSSVRGFRFKESA